MPLPKFSNLGFLGSEILDLGTLVIFLKNWIFYDKYVYLFKDKETDKEIYGYYNTNYLTSASVENIITNGSKFVNTSGWAGILLSDAGDTKPPVIDS